MNTDPIIAVKNVQKSAIWYQDVFGCNSAHGGDEFEVLISEEKEILLCLHAWDIHDHPSMTIKENRSPGNGLILYFRVKNMEVIRENLKKMNYPIEKEIEVNSNSHKKEFAVIDLDGYHLIISDFHNYGL